MHLPISHQPEQKGTDTEVTSDEEEVGGGFTVYECPGLAPVSMQTPETPQNDFWLVVLFIVNNLSSQTGEMEVKNPLFDDSTPDYQGNPKWTRNTLHTLTHSHEKFLWKKAPVFSLPALKQDWCCGKDCFLIRFLTYWPHYSFFNATKM